MLATVNGAEYHNFHHLGSLGPGYQADVLCFDRLDGWEPGARVARGPARRRRRRRRARRGARHTCAGVDVPFGAPAAPAVGRGARPARSRVGPRARHRRRRRQPVDAVTRPRPARSGGGRRAHRGTGTPPPDRARRARLRVRLRPAARRNRLDGRARRAQLHARRCPRWFGAARHGHRRGAARGDRGRPGRGRRRRGRGRGPPADRRPDERPPRRGSRRRAHHARRYRPQPAGRDDRRAVHAAQLPRPLGDPSAADHRQGSRRRRPLRAHHRRRAG